jgi:hypothetical protein
MKKSFFSKKHRIFAPEFYAGNGWTEAVKTGKSFSPKSYPLRQKWKLNYCSLIGYKKALLSLQQSCQTVNFFVINRFFLVDPLCVLKHFMLTIVIFNTAKFHQIFGGKDINNFLYPRNFFRKYFFLFTNYTNLTNFLNFYRITRIEKFFGFFPICAWLADLLILQILLIVWKIFALTLVS